MTNGVWGQNVWGLIWAEGVWCFSTWIEREPAGGGWTAIAGASDIWTERPAASGDWTEQ